jgi:hypothetical protein
MEDLVAVALLALQQLHSLVVQEIRQAPLRLKGVMVVEVLRLHSLD